MTKVVVLVLEIAFTVMIVLNCLNMISDQRQRLTKPTGIDEENIIAVQARPFAAAYQEREFRIQLVDRDAAALRALPGVIDATPISTYPLQGGGSSFQLKPLGAPDSDLVRSPVYSADPHFLATLDLELVAGRAFTEADLPVEAGPRISNLIVTKDLADALYPDGDAVGQTVDTGSEEYPDVIVGVVDYMFTPYGGGPMETRISFYPNRPASSSRMRYLIRTDPDAYDEVFAAVDKTLLDNQPDRLVEVRTMVDVKGGGFVMNQFLVTVLGAIVFLLLFVTGLGIFGMTSFSVTQRTKQVGTRRALGATRGAVLRYFLVENALITTFGLALGLVCAYGLNVLLVNNVDGTPLGLDQVVLGIVILWLLGLAATAVPAVKASRLSPALATRTV
ncbi:MAG: FtsX-like permease family protein [Thermoanaerobaculia bacterium]